MDKFHPARRRRARRHATHRARARARRRTRVIFCLALDVSARPRPSSAPFDGGARAQWCHDAPALRASSRAMSDDERFWFDTNGFDTEKCLLVDDVAAMRDAIDARVDSSVKAERTGALR